MGHRDLLVTHNLSDDKHHDCRPHARGSVRRASGFVLTGNPEVIDGSPAPEWQVFIQTTKSGVQISTPPQIKEKGRLSLPSCEPSLCKWVGIFGDLACLDGGSSPTAIHHSTQMDQFEKSHEAAKELLRSAARQNPP